ncbi:pyrroloquinoline quinone-dependent dehydrogenase [Pseudomaricurvus alkylphenolicus]|jgi:quinoprotein glucose dehydrogenase|uniref:pyrroloquinoline quinone-dependent dehydrogenase n=1 Tax=Pseudomaricurvus alkylphenolicus TaxID=1306991 RepID=UPI00141DD354|nr:pyrroloquinoline quinone-dependent dehydrogenase [Pseudomaricurvus alkylphenolicus]NIB40553.1 pyrroloquinoline quinone-dependent dehydrogenase [Pseudomaricurvus alkylphenolicus]
MRKRFIPSLFYRLLPLTFLALFGCQENVSTTSFGTSQTELIPAESAIGWPTYGGQPSGTQYSSLEQIHRGNVDDLEVAWTYHVGENPGPGDDVDPVTYQVTPIIANGMMYLCSPFNNIIALNPGTGEEIWRFDPDKDPRDTFYGHNCRGVSYWESEEASVREQRCGKRVFETVQNGFLLGVDADTGELCTDFGDQGRVNLNALDYKGSGKLYSASPPAIYKNAVIVGGGFHDNMYGDAIDGIIRAFDARTGKELWHWNPIPEHLSDKVGGANAWAPLSIDMDRGWVFLPTGSPSYDVYGTARTEPIPHGNAVVVLDALTGELVWSYQTVHHDLWDYDVPAMPTLVRVQRQGEVREAVLQPTKTGYVFLFDRETGEPLFEVKEIPVPSSDVAGEVNSPTQPVPTLPASVTSTQISMEDGWGAMLIDEWECESKLEPLRNEGLFTPPSVNGSVLHPSFLGGSNWGGIAYDAASGLAVVNSSNLVSSVTLVKRDEYDKEKHPGSYYEMKGAPYVMARNVLLSSITGAPCNPPPWGNLTAIDMNTGETRWRIPFGQVELFGPFKSPQAWGAPNQGGPIITAGGLVFIGASPDSLLRAYDLHTGELLWKGDIPAPAIATPMTYAYGEKPQQYVVIAAGGHDGFETVKSDAIVAFRLKK